MAQLLVRDIDPKQSTALKARAKKYNRSLQGEAKMYSRRSCAKNDNGRIQGARKNNKGKFWRQKIFR